MHLCLTANNSLMGSGSDMRGSGSDRGAASQDFRLLSVELCLRQHAGVEQLLELPQLCGFVRHLRYRDKKSEVTKQPVVLEDDGGSLLESSSRILGFIFGF